MSYDQVICPMCGTAHGTRYRKNRQKAKWYRIGTPVNHWQDQLDRLDEEYHFGVSQEGGKGGRSLVETWNEDDPRAQPFLSPIRQLLLRNIAKFIIRGLIKPEEVEEVLQEVRKK